MNKILVIAHREYAAMVATKAFLFTIIVMPILMFGGIFLMPRLSKLSSGKTREIVVVDQTGKLFGQLKTLSDARTDAIKNASSENEEEDGFADQIDFWNLREPEQRTLSDELRLELSNQIRDGKLYAFVEIPANVFEMGQEAFPAARFVSQDAVLSSAKQWMEQVLGEIIREQRLKELGVDTGLVAKASVPIAMEPTPPYSANAAGELVAEKPSNIMVTLFLPFGIMMLMFMVIFLTAQPMLESGMEEKGQRIAELLLGAVSPTQLMAGKLLGNVCGSLVVFVIYAIGAWSILSANDMDHYVPMAVVPWFLIFQLLAVLFFSSIFLTVGASISELKEAQSLLLPVWLILSAPLMVWFTAIRDPNGVVATSMSFFPPSAPLMMTLRLATGQSIPLWQPPAAAILLLISTAIIVFIAGRIYRASLLRTDSAATFKQMFGRLRST